MSKIGMLVFYLIEFLMQGRRSQFSVLYTIAGSLLIMVGAAIGSYSLFNFLVPRIGFNEAGIAIFLILTCIGIVLLIISAYKKKTTTSHDFLKLIQTFQDQTNLSGFMKENGKKVLVFSLIGGILLARLMKSTRK